MAAGHPHRGIRMDDSPKEKTLLQSIRKGIEKEK
jgi:hypothetical protein